VPPPTRPRRYDLLLPVVGAALGLAVGAMAGHHLRMTVPKGCQTGCNTDYGISGVAAGAVWGALAGVVGASVYRGWRTRLGSIGVFVIVVLFTIFEPK
jgi:peptidoglycan/LPS O-acetylase OafA/YrhL